MLSAIEYCTDRNPLASVIWMHGLGADGNDFVPIVRELGLPETLPVRFIFPSAPMRPVTINNGYVMRAWYDIAYEGLERRADEGGIRASQRQVEELIAHEHSLGIPFRRIVLAGFSQGGAIALQTGLRYGARLGGIMALSTYLPLADALPKEASAENKDIPIFMAHGTQDDVIAIELAERSRDALKQSGYPVAWHSYPMAHSVCAEEVDAIGGWLKGLLG